MTEEIDFELQYDYDYETKVALKCSPLPRRKYRRIKKTDLSESSEQKPVVSGASFLVPGVEKVTLSSQTQELLDCIVNETVTDENPWKRVSKVSIENIIRSDPASEFKVLKKKVRNFPKDDVLLIYLPSNDTEEHEFLICLTVEADDEVSDIIEDILAEREEYLKNVSIKCARTWKTLGSSKEIIDLENRNNRPLLEMEVQTSYPILKIPIKFRLRMVEDAKDGYVEILSQRMSFNNLVKKTIDCYVQNTPAVKTDCCQTIYRYPKHVTTQYQYSYKKVELNKYLTKMLTVFFKDSMSHMHEPIYVNGYFDFHANDYINLIKNENYLSRNNLAEIEEFASFYNHTLVKEKMVAAVSWHPMWTGVVAISYAFQAPNVYRVSKPKVDEVLNAVHNVSPVLLWSFADKLVPSLVLETPRDVTALSFCPYDENILIGGTISGQVLIWDLTNRLKRVEDEIILSPKQLDYRNRMYSLITWMKRTHDPKLVRPVVVSHMGYSHKNAIMQISWVCPYNEITRAGKINKITDEEKRNSMEFTTISLDGSILVWNLKGKVPIGASRRARRTGRLKVFPEGLLTDISPYKSLNRIFKPIFKANVLVPNDMRPPSLVIAGRQNVPVSYIEKQKETVNTPHTTARKYYKPVLQRSFSILENCYVLGSVEGEVLRCSWEGYDFRSSETVTYETSEVTYFSKFHDGIVVSLALCPERNDFILSVGGKIFAFWLLDYPKKPILWKKSKYRYGYGEWCTFRHSMIFLCRADGSIELWNLSLQNNHYQSVIHVSGGALSGLYLHPLPLKREVIGVCDYTQAMRLFYIDRNQNINYNEENKKFHNLIDKELEIKRSLDKWNQEWNKKNPHMLEIKRQKTLEIEKKIQENKQIKAAKSEVKKEVEELQKPVVENIKDVWKVKEIERINTVLLGKKGINIEFIKSQTQPLVTLTKELQKKKEKLKLFSSQASKIFEETLTTNFPDVIEKKSESTSDPYSGGDFIHKKDMFINNYRDIEEFYGEYVEQHKYKYEFDWIKMLKDGKERSKFLNLSSQRTTHKSRLMRERNKKNETSIYKNQLDTSNDNLSFY